MRPFLRGASAWNPMIDIGTDWLRCRYGHIFAPQDEKPAPASSTRPEPMTAYQGAGGGYCVFSTSLCPLDAS